MNKPTIPFVALAALLATALALLILPSDGTTGEPASDLAAEPAEPAEGTSPDGVGPSPEEVKPERVAAEAKAGAKAGAGAEGEAESRQAASILTVEVQTVTDTRPRTSCGGIRFELRRDREGLFGPPLASGRTDGDGKAVVQLEIEPCTLAAWVREPGYQLFRRTVSVSRKKAGLPVKVVLSARSGGTAIGTAYLDSQPVPTRVRAHDEGAAPAVYSDQVRITIEAQGSPRFLVHYTENWSGRLVARSPEGTGSLDVLLTGAQPDQDLRIELAGPGVLRGVVRDLAGEPASGLPLRALPAALDRGLRADQDWLAGAWEQERQGQGNLCGWTRTEGMAASS